MIPKISQVVKALVASNGALRLDHVLTECGISPTAENLHDTVKAVEGWRLGWTAEDEDARLPIPAAGNGSVVGLATTKAQKRFGLNESVYQDTHRADDGTVQKSYVPFPDDPRVQKRAPRAGSGQKTDDKPNRWMPCLVLCDTALLVKRADMTGDVMTTLDSLPAEYRGLFGEVKTARPSTVSGWAIVNMLVKLPSTDDSDE